MFLKPRYGAYTCVPDLREIKLIVVEIFHRKKCKPACGLRSNVTEVCRIHPLGTVNDYTSFLFTVLA